jgi:hypothetical protein
MLQEREMDRPERWSARRKSEIVVRLLRGEDLGELSRKIKLPPPVIEQWREAFLSGAEVGLRKLLVILNSMLRSGTAWCPQVAPTEG